MSMDRCTCGNIVDTDSDPECYLVTYETFNLPHEKQDFVCTCQDCRALLSDLELDLRLAA